MRVLWLTNGVALYRCGRAAAHNGGGWVTAAQRQMMSLQGITLGVSFFLGGEPARVEQDGVMYYPLAPMAKHRWRDLARTLTNDTDFSTDSYATVLEQYRRVLSDFRPDIIHVFGSETALGLIALVATVPVVLHIQGVINPYINAYLPPGM